ncbi:MAG: plasmid stabilization protein [Candidatus Rokuibacteriota bacterium]|nr:MAG: plasmid stabilization protein [Candidatus Rokubacteria bacterium]PYO55828.1 MAG: plasmid stabilization protein [Candidatus Rokubacteria bacterium]
MIPYSFHPEAEAELVGAALFYESRMVGLGRAFATEVERTVSLIREHPDAGSPAGLPHRQMRVHRFPYSVVYRRDQESLLILAVAHQRRHPGYWRRRV